MPFRQITIAQGRIEEKRVKTRKGWTWQTCGDKEEFKHVVVRLVSLCKNKWKGHIRKSGAVHTGLSSNLFTRYYYAKNEKKTMVAKKVDWASSSSLWSPSPHTICTNHRRVVRVKRTTRKLEKLKSSNLIWNYWNLGCTYMPPLSD